MAKLLNLLRRDNAQSWEVQNNAKAIIKEPEIAIGGSKTEKDSKDIKYGGKVKITFKNPDTAKNNSDGYYIWLEPISSTEAYDIKGNKWIEF